MGDLGELSGLDLAGVAPLPTSRRGIDLRSPTERGGRPVLQGSAFLRAMGLAAENIGRCRALDPGAREPFGETALRGCASRLDA